MGIYCIRNELSIPSITLFLTKSQKPFVTKSSGLGARAQHLGRPLHFKTGVSLYSIPAYLDLLGAFFCTTST